MLTIDVFTLFPEMFVGPLTESILKRAQETGLLAVHLHQIRDWATDKHRVVDEPPYGGGGGMVLKPGPLVSAVQEIIPPDAAVPVFLMSPQGRVFNQALASELSSMPRFALVCGHYLLVIMCLPVVNSLLW